MLSSTADTRKQSRAAARRSSVAVRRAVGAAAIRVWCRRRVAAALCRRGGWLDAATSARSAGSAEREQVQTVIDAADDEMNAG